MWLILLLMVPVGTMWGQELIYTYNSTDPGTPDLSFLNRTKCSALNEDLDIVYYSNLGDGSNQHHRRTFNHTYIRGPCKKASLIKNHIMEQNFHSECPLDPAMCDKGFTISMWFSFVANNPQWAENWPPVEECRLVSIKNNIMITSETTGSGVEAEIKLHIDFRTTSQDASYFYKRLTLSSSQSDLLKPHLSVCKDQSATSNCTEKSQDFRKKVGWQWNQLSIVASKDTSASDNAYTLRAFLNGNPFPVAKITIGTTEPPFEVISNGIKLNHYASANTLAGESTTSCDQIGVDEFTLWERPLSQQEVLELRTTCYCDDTSTKPPVRSAAEQGIDVNQVPSTITPAQGNDLTFVNDTCDKLNKLASDMSVIAESIPPDEISAFVSVQTKNVGNIGKDSTVFTNENVPAAEKEEFGENLITVMESMLGLVSASLLEDKTKEDLAVGIVSNCEQIAENALSATEDISFKTAYIAMLTKSKSSKTGSLGFEVGSVSAMIPCASAKTVCRAVVTTIDRNILEGLLKDIHVNTSLKPRNKRDTSETEPNPNKLLGGMLTISQLDVENGEELAEPITFCNSQEPDEDAYLTCAYMCTDTEAGDSQWCMDGVTTIEEGGDCGMKCVSTHMTNFAVLMSATEIKIPAAHVQTLSTITIVCTSISLVALFLAILILFIFRELTGTRISILKHLCISIFIAQLVFITAIEKAAFNRKLCLVIAVFIHYLWLSVFFWMLAQGLFLYMKLRVAVRSDANIVWFCLIGWGFPAIMVTVTAGINIKAYGRDDLCWLNLEGGGVWAFIGPVLAIVILNSIVIVMAMKAFVSVKSFKDKDEKEKFRSSLKAMIVLLPVLGLTWIFGVFTHIPGGGGIAFMYIFAFCNSLQGLFLFIFHIVFNSEVRRVVKRAILKRSGNIAPGEEPSFFRKMLGQENNTEKTASSGFTKSSAM